MLKQIGLPWTSRLPAAITDPVTSSHVFENVPATTGERNYVVQAHFRALDSQTADMADALVPTEDSIVIDSDSRSCTSPMGVFAISLQVAVAPSARVIRSFNPVPCVPVLPVLGTSRSSTRNGLSVASAGQIQMSQPPSLGPRVLFGAMRLAIKAFLLFVGVSVISPVARPANTRREKLGRVATAARAKDSLNSHGKVVPFLAALPAVVSGAGAPLCPFYQGFR